MEPIDGWPLDRILVGVATVRTIRELLWQCVTPHGYAVRAWDLSLCSGVSPQGSANTLERLRREGLVDVLRSDPGSARRYALVEHPLLEPLGWLFSDERKAYPDVIRPALRPDPSRLSLSRPDPSRPNSPRGGSATPA
jgi:hypothetical protein